MKKNKLPIIDKKNFPYQLAMVYWEDIVGDVSWADIPDIKKSKTAICCSVGWIVHNNKTTVVMADFIFLVTPNIQTFYLLVEIVVEEFYLIYLHN